MTDGSAGIYNNAKGCSSAEEMLASCTAGLNEESETIGHLKLYPNPSVDIIYIEMINMSSKSAVFDIYDLNGRKITERLMTERQTAVDVSGLPHGVYIVKVTDDRMVETEKMLKQ